MVACLGLTLRQGPAATVTFVGITHASNGVRIGKFRITNQSGLRIARNGYCRLDGRTVDIFPTVNLEAGEAHTVDVPLSGTPKAEGDEIIFNGVRDLNQTEALLDLADQLLQRVGLHWRWLDTAERRKWEARCGFNGSTHAPAE